MLNRNPKTFVLTGTVGVLLVSEMEGGKKKGDSWNAVEMLTILKNYKESVYLSVDNG